MRTSTTTLGAVALAAALADAASTTGTTTQTVFLPPLSTGSASNIYASIITETDSTTKYLLACSTFFASPYSCEGPYNGVTVTYGPSEMDVNIGASTYDCELGSSAVCATKTASAADERTTTLNPTESAQWMTPITVLDTGKKSSSKKSSSSKTNTADAQESSGSSGLCKRKTTNSGSDGSSSGSSSSSSSSKSSKSGKDGDCSAASTVTRDMGVFGLFLGTGLVFAIGL
ncbi:hypothetical protein G7Z17_g5570 [Cylindrodendrum hubeiense]|uniref:Uncharacterized protein n=1 Tax=Cylindrodendrum hubeiense TaxID=595255 RepID=A0A9P5H6U7_9HYPO|nr:hypothetical protein G7Z17_g5570 [Cylindrodendrum hubeiense]